MNLNLILIGVFIILIGFIMLKVKPNSIIGIRVSWTIKDENIWTKRITLPGDFLFFAES
jgi:uncharacterized membrane protein